MKKFQGKGVYGAVAVGSASVFGRADTVIKRTHADDTENELKRFEAAKALALSRLSDIYKKAVMDAGDAGAEIFGIHMMMIEDEDYNGYIKNVIETQKVNAEYAVAAASDSFSEMFASMEDEYMRARAADIKDISARIIACMGDGASPAVTDNEKTIVCADDLAPSETILLDRDRVLAFATAYGSANSHTAILARSMSIPAVVGAGEGFLAEVRDGDEIIVDGHTGEIFISPDGETRQRLIKKRDDDIENQRLLRELKGKDNVTRDGRRINICANIGGIEDADAALRNDAGGIGLFRSEFLYLESSDFPSEDTQFAVYKKVLEKMAGKKVIIRTLDIGADKQASYFGLDKEENPALGLRAIRICLTRPEIFRTQLRALYRASAFGELGIMFPMITGADEVRRCIDMCARVREELSGEGIPYSGSVELGIMIETPAAAVISDILAPMVDFFSVGTNDLTQYTLACDRQNPNVEQFADTHHEAVLRLIAMAAENAHKNGIWIGICGELAADTSLTEAFIGMGIDELSVSPTFILPLRSAVRRIGGK